MNNNAGDITLHFDAEDRLTSKKCSNAKTVKLEEISNGICLNLHSVTFLEISNTDIAEIPSSIQRLSLKELVLCRNKLKEVPSCLYTGLEHIEILDLSHNLLTNFQIEPSCHMVLKKLNISNNQIKGFPHWILTVLCPQLTQVAFSGNFMDTVNCSKNLNLKILEMRNCQARDLDFKFLKKIDGLEVLDLGNDCEGQKENIFKNLDELFIKFKWKGLRVLRLSNIMMSVIPKNLFYVDSLVELHLVNCDLNWIPEDVQYLRNLKILDVSQNAICALSAPFTCLENLRVVRAPFNNIATVEVFRISLEILDLYNNQIEELYDQETIKLIDLELNYFDTRNLVNFEVYKQKRDEFRQNSSFQRDEGPRVRTPVCYPYDDDSKSYSDYDCYSEGYQGNNDYNCDIDTPLESWDDDEVPKSICVQRNPDITPSDDEWNCLEDFVKMTKKKDKWILQYDENEDWIFCDAEES